MSNFEIIRKGLNLLAPYVYDTTEITEAGNWIHVMEDQPIAIPAEIVEELKKLGWLIGMDNYWCAPMAQ